MQPIHGHRPYDPYAPVPLPSYGPPPEFVPPQQQQSADPTAITDAQIGAKWRSMAARATAQYKDAVHGASQDVHSPSPTSRDRTARPADVAALLSTIPTQQQRQ